jgi:hypothetical protein
MTTITLFDQKTWVDQYKKELKGLSVKETFLFIFHKHPLSGCALPLLSSGEHKKIMKEMKTMPMLDIAKYADAVTVACVDNPNLVKSFNYDDVSNCICDTTIGNAAYIALYTKDSNIRKKMFDWVKKWQESK